MKYRKKPVEVEAVQWTGRNLAEILDFCPTARYWYPQTHIEGCEDMRLIIPTLEGDHVANDGDFIIKGVKGEFYPCKPDIFEQTYEAIE